MSVDEVTMRKLREIQKPIADVLNRVNKEGGSRTLALFALLRLARQILEMLPEGEREMMLDQLVVPFLTGEPVDGDTGRILTL